MPYSKESNPRAPSHACMLSCFSRVRLFATLRTVDSQAPLSMVFSRQDYWSGLSCPPPGDLSHPGIKSSSLTSPASAGGFFTTSTTWEAPKSQMWGQKGKKKKPNPPCDSIVGGAKAAWNLRRKINTSLASAEEEQRNEKRWGRQNLHFATVVMTGSCTVSGEYQVYVWREVK